MRKAFSHSIHSFLSLSSLTFNVEDLWEIGKTVQRYCELSSSTPSYTRYNHNRTKTKKMMLVWVSSRCSSIPQPFSSLTPPLLPTVPNPNSHWSLFHHCDFCHFEILYKWKVCDLSFSFLSSSLPFFLPTLPPFFLPSFTVMGINPGLHTCEASALSLSHIPDLCDHLRFLFVSI